MKRSTTLIIYGDGGSRGNPGQAAYGYVVYDQDRNMLHEEGGRLGITTNNVAEYTAVIEALKWVEKNVKNGLHEVKFYLDSKLVASQMSGIFKVKHPNMKTLFADAKRIESRLGCKVGYNAIPREDNTEADRLVNNALDFIS